MAKVINLCFPHPSRWSLKKSGNLTQTRQFSTQVESALNL